MTAPSEKASPEPPPNERLYSLLPAVYRLRDREAGQPLRALLGIFEEERLRVEADIHRLYDNWFIETCDEWVIPYLGDLVGQRLSAQLNQRAHVANALRYRRRKGTLSALSALARDITGWPARAVEYFQLVATSQHVNSERPTQIVIPDLRQMRELGRLGGPFESITHCIDVRESGRYGPTRVGLFLWRQPCCYLDAVVAKKNDLQAGGYWLNPLGFDQGIWGPGSQDAASDFLETCEVTETSVPQPVRRRPLHDALEDHRCALQEGRTPKNPYFGSRPLWRIAIVKDAGTAEVPPEQVLVADLSDWQTPPPDTLLSVAVDPELGRLTLADPSGVKQVLVSYYTVGTGDIGSSSDDCSDSQAVSDAAASCFTLSAGASLTDRSAQWTNSGHVILDIADSQTYALSQSLKIPSGATVELRAANRQRPLLRVSPGCQIELGEGSALTMSGLVIEGELSFVPCASPSAPTASLAFEHCTLIPRGWVQNVTEEAELERRLEARCRFGESAGSSVAEPQSDASSRQEGGSEAGATSAPTEPQPCIRVADGFAAFAVSLKSCISGPLVLPAQSRVCATESVLDAMRTNLAALSVDCASLQYVTVLGQTQVATHLDASESIFYEKIEASAGSLRFCYVPADSKVGSATASNCQPALALADAGANADDVKARVRPWFRSLRYGMPGYAQLHRGCASELRHGSSSGSELGVFHRLQHVQREEDLLASQAESLRFGLTSNLFDAT